MWALIGGKPEAFYGYAGEIIGENLSSDTFK